MTNLTPRQSYMRYGVNTTNEGGPNPMPDTQQIKTRIEAAQRELAKAQAELAKAETRPKYEPDSLYLIQEPPRWAYVSYGRDMSTDENGCVQSSRFVTVGRNVDGRISSSSSTKSVASGQPFVGRPTTFLEGSTVVRLHKGDL